MKTMNVLIMSAALVAATAISASAFTDPAGSGADPKHLTAAQTGINGGSLSATLTATSADMKGYSEIAYHIDVTAGTTTAITVECEESDDNTKWFDALHCTDADPATCGPATLTLGVTDQSVVFKPRARYARCIFDDTDDGNGTVIVTATLSAP